MCDVLDKVENRGIEKGIVKGESRGENKMALLVKKLLDQNRIDDVKRAFEDEKEPCGVDERAWNQLKN